MTEIIKLTFIGDISLNDDYSPAAKNDENPFAQVQDYLRQSDLVIGNLEAVSQGNDGENNDKRTRLRIDYETLQLLQYLHVDILTLANNHIYDQLFDGFRRTVDFLDRENISYLGAFSKGGENKSTCQQTVKGKKIAFLNYVHPSTNPLLPKDCALVVNMYDKNLIVSEIKRQRTDADCLILLLHWGTDNSRFPEPWQRSDAREFAEAGADIIVGHHSHVLQGFEKIGKSWAFYSLGNFAFSRHFSNNKYYELSDRQRESVVLDWLAGSSASKIQLHPVRLQGITVIPIKSNRIKRLSFMIPFVSNKAIWPFYKFYLNVIYKTCFYFFGIGRNPFLQLLRTDRRKIVRLMQILGIKK